MTWRSNEPTRPLTPATFHILLSLTHEAAHGYNIKRMVEERTNGAVLLGAGTLYAGIRRMAKDGLIQESEPPQDAGEVEPGSRWRFYSITPRGRDVLEAEVTRLESDLAAAQRGEARYALQALGALRFYGLGIGANTAMFGAVNGVLLGPLPCPSDSSETFAPLEPTSVGNGAVAGLS